MKRVERTEGPGGIVRDMSLLPPPLTALHLARECHMRPNMGHILSFHHHRWSRDRLQTRRVEIFFTISR